MSGEDESRSELQSNWQLIALRLRLVIENTLAFAEAQTAKANPPDYVEPKHLHDLATAALSVFALERQAASLDISLQRERGWN